MTDKIRLGVIGCGGIALSKHLPALAILKKAGLDNFEVAALCDAADANLDKAAAYARRAFGTEPLTYRSWEELVAAGTVDAVDICLPHGLHHVVGIACLDAGIHVVVEKPPAVSLKTGKRFVEAAARNNRILSAAIPMRRLPGQRAVHWALNDARLIGDVRTFFHNITSFKAPSPSASDANRWRRDRVMGGGNTVLDSGTHFTDSLRYLYGEVEQVYAEVRAYPDGGGTVLGREALVQHRENVVMAVITFKSGVIGTWCWSTIAAGRETRTCVIHGTEGSIEDANYAEGSIVCHPFKGPAELRKRDGTCLSMRELQVRHQRAIGPEAVQKLFPNGVTDEFALTLWDFLEAIEMGRAPEISGADGLISQAVAEALYESSWSGQAVNVDKLLSGETPSLWQADIDAYWDAYVTPAAAVRA
ncbi:MAG TPA: Gfo/Idh/MocA family oxidoreductase [Chloroflexota bacterium]|nr:Gfo/Idh/MocA family oxidoreductase [Chloroflexota bacterium]